MSITSISGSSRTSTSTTHGRNSLAAVQLNDIRELYQDIIGRSMPMFLQRQVMEDLTEANGTQSYEWYVYALEETACAPRPSWNYVKAIYHRLWVESKGLTVGRRQDLPM